jgi:hypothetical protein
MCQHLQTDAIRGRLISELSQRSTVRLILSIPDNGTNLLASPTHTLLVLKDSKQKSSDDSSHCTPHCEHADELRKS